MGVIRSTVWVGPDGKVKKHWHKVAKAADHQQKVLEAVQASYLTCDLIGSARMLWVDP